jgi:hypothetical protein
MQALKTSAIICLDALHECHNNPPDALLNAAIQLHDGSLLVSDDISNQARCSQSRSKQGIRAAQQRVVHDGHSISPAQFASRVTVILCSVWSSQSYAAAASATANASAAACGDGDITQSLGDLRPDVQDAVAKLCCSWWQYEARDREYLVAQTLPYLLVSCIAPAIVTNWLNMHHRSFLAPIVWLLLFNLNIIPGALMLMIGQSPPQRLACHRLSEV